MTHDGVWLFLEGREVLLQVSQILEPLGLEVGMAGSVLRSGTSAKDLDLIVFPRSTAASPPSDEELQAALTRAGLHRKHSVAQVHARWRAKDSLDQKRVEVYQRRQCGRRVDIFFLR